jgi:membrane fusion protein, protease secretion system
MKLIDKKALATDVVTHDVSPLTVNTDAGAYSKLGWLIVLLGVGGFLLWALFAPLDKGVPLSGNVAKESNRKAVQHLSGGTVDDILVKEGDTVKAGQVLVRMNGVQVLAQAEISRAQYFTARAAEARLIAERDGKKTVAFPPALASSKSDPRVTEKISLQNQLFSARQSALQNELGALAENIAGVKVQITSLEASRESKKQQLLIVKEQLDNMRDLAKDGYVARSKLLDVERTYIQINGGISEDIGAIGRAQRQVMELNLRRIQRSQEYQKEVRSQLSDIQKEAEALASRMVVEDYAVANVDVKSPVDGVVVGVNVFTRGGVVQPGFRMMDVVPSDDALIVEGQLPVNLIDKVHPGLPVELIFSAFNTNTTPHVAGEVTQVSADRLLDEKTGAPYYKMLAKVTPAGLKVIRQDKLEVRPGMPVELFVKTGERTMMSYLLKPVLDRAKTSLTEE